MNEKQKAAMEARKRWSRREFYSRLSEVHRDCEFANYQEFDLGDGITNARALRLMRRYADSPAKAIETQTNVLLYGMPGTGKDHLLAAAGKAFADAGFYVRWAVGPELWRRLDATRHTQPRDDDYVPDTQDDLIESYADPDVLWLSDIVGRGQVLSDARTSFLFSLMDRRYNAKKVTWLSINLNDKTEIENSIGSSTTDRFLGKYVLSICFNWPSYRGDEPTWLGD